MKNKESKYINEIKSSINNSPTFELDSKIDFDVEELIQESYLNMEYVGETIERKAKDILKTYEFSISIRNFYGYLMREIIRNVVEHSEAKKFSVLLYSNHLKEFSFKVIDNGIGIMRSLNSNPAYSINDDLTALSFCVKPGITRSYKRDPMRDDVWQNSGFGLYMVSSIVSSIGVFEIISGSGKLVLKNGFKEHTSAKIKGTEVTVIINTTIEINISNTIKKVSIEGSKIAECGSSFSEFAKIKTASKASTLLKPE
ncbi:ATP-binding protein [Clostridium algidicarnis]|uniref:ATP-binding protein n=1 Tax=Clostridium algidicarnis TaxID=37659 RepID=UPI001C0BED3C|nr:ATP-binding protein [Clostridium algidicarnis]MBU3208500.1 ATP-binding protein [Clostridium algidicarnis]